MKTLITLFSEKVNGVDAPTVAGMVRRHLSPRFRFTEKSQEGTTTFQIEDIEDKGNPMGAIEVYRLLDQCLLRAVKWHYVGTGLEPEPKKSELEELNRLYHEALRNAYLHVRDAIGKELDLLGYLPPDSPAHPALQPPADGQSGKLEKIAEGRILERGERVTEARLKRELEDMQIESMMDTHAPGMIASKLGMNEDTLVSRIKKLRSRQNSP